MTSQQPSDSFDVSSVAHDLAHQMQDLIERVTSAAPTDASTLAAVARQLRSIIESTAAISAAPVRQMEIIADTVRQQRSHIKTLQQQLRLFDDQLALLESTMGPALTVGNQWTNTQQAMVGLIRPRNGP
jgi:hypothetical protein